MHHGGHVNAGDFAEGLENWRKAVERIERPLPMLIENTMRRRQCRWPAPWMRSGSSGTR